AGGRARLQREAQARLQRALILLCHKTVVRFANRCVRMEIELTRSSIECLAIGVSDLRSARVSGVSNSRARRPSDGRCEPAAPADDRCYDGPQAATESMQSRAELVGGLLRKPRCKGGSDGGA